MKARSTVSASLLLPGWLRAPALSIGAAKEFREILPYWVVAVVTSLVWLVGWPEAGTDHGMGWALYWAGELAVVAMGAASFGHEFTHRTMLLALSQPRARQEVWWLKMRVLGMAMGLVVLVRLAGPVLHGNSQSIVGFAGLMSVSALAYGLLVAPLFALWSRSTLAGTVFTVALPIVTWQAACLVAAIEYGVQSVEAAAVPQPATGYFVMAVLGQWLLAPILAYHAFRRLQATEARGQALRLPRWLRRGESPAAGVRRRRGVWLALTRKELRLLTPAYVVAGLYLLVALFDLAQRRLAAAELGVAVTRSSSTEVATLIYAVLVSLLTGALACAEDRHAGTLPWHLVQPVTVWRQWLVKVTVALTVALVLAVGLPLVVLDAEEARSLAANFTSQMPFGYWLAAGQVLVLCTLALYISTLTGNALRAMLWAAPIGLGLETLAWGFLDSAEARASLWNWFVPFETQGRSVASLAGVTWLLVWGALAAGAFLIPMACACRNFRRLDQSAARVMRHVGLVVGYGLFAGAACVSFKSVMNAAGVSLPMRPPNPAFVQWQACQENVDAIIGAVTRYKIAHDDQPPLSLAALTNELASPLVLVCPADKDRQPATTWATWNPGQITYGYELRRSPAHADWDAAIRCPVHRGDWVFERVLLRYGQSPEEADPGASPSNRTPPGTPRMDPRMLRRYGLLPKPAQPAR